jgi:hypothetical protein
MKPKAEGPGHAETPISLAVPVYVQEQCLVNEEEVPSFIIM